MNKGSKVFGAECAFLCHYFDFLYKYKSKEIKTNLIPISHLLKHLFHKLYYFHNKIQKIILYYSINKFY